MKFITVRDFRSSPSKIWKELPEEQELVITNNGKPIALLTPLNDSNLEDTLSAVRKARAQNAVEKMQRTSIQRGTKDLTDTEIDKEIADARAEVK